MAILDLSLVTKVLRRVVLETVKESPAWKPRPDPTISPLPPDKLKAESLGIYLYHVIEDAQFKNQPPVSSSADPVPVSYTPMALNLHYLISTDGVVEDDTKMYDAQLLLGLVVKALHDYPLINDDTEINGINIFEEIGINKTNTRLRLHMQPITYNEAVSYWTAGQSPLRLSAYYEVQVILLEPEEPPSRSGRVLDYGVFSFVTGAPRLHTSKNILNVTIPESGITQDIELRSAEVPIGSGIEFLGVNLSSDDTRLVINNSRWSEPMTADLSWGAIAIDERALATIQEQIDGEDIIPGIYTAKVLTRESRIMPDGSTRWFNQSSNETPFTITPRMNDEVVTPNPSGLVTIQGYIFEHTEIEEEDIQVFLGTELLPEGTTGSLNPGEYAVIDATHIELQLPTGLAVGYIPFRLIIHGAESPPIWVNIT